MIYIIFIIIGIIIITEISFLKKLKKSKNQIEIINDKITEIPYTKKEFILSKAEFGLYKKLKPIVEKYNMTIFCKVRLCDIIEIEKGNKNWQSNFNKIKSKHIDFLLCNNEYLQNKIAIELNDSSHNKQNRIERDDFIKAIFEKVKMPFLIIIENGNYIESDLERKICELCNIEIKE